MWPRPNTSSVGCVGGHILRYRDRQSDERRQIIKNDFGGRFACWDFNRRQVGVKSH